MTENIPKKEKISPIEKIRDIFEKNKNKKICVVGPSCVGKTTLLNQLPDAVDMDDLLFGNEDKNIKPLLTEEEIKYVCGPWSEEVGKFMDKKAKELIKIEPGHPVFGTIVFPSDLIIEITIPDNILRERIRRRNANEEDVFNMKTQIESEIKKSGIEKIELINI